MKVFKKEILKILFKYITKDSCVVFGFGSFAKNKVYPSSDIDIGTRKICDNDTGIGVGVVLKASLG